jgi:membrane AbrB-like protein
MLGPLTATMIYQAASGSRARWSVNFRQAALIVIGYSIGRTVNADTARQILVHLPAMVVVTLLTVLFCMATGYFTHRRTGITLQSGLLGSMPGGLAQMMVLCEEIGNTDLAVVMLIQVTRILAVVFIVPFVATYGMVHLPVNAAAALGVAAAMPLGLVGILPALLVPPLGAWLAVRLKVPLPYLFGPIVMTAVAGLIGYAAPPVPRWLAITAQLCFGIYLGRSIPLDSLRRLGKVLPYAAGGAIALVGFCYLLSLGLSLVMPATLLTTFLGTAPGGLAEMCIVGLTLGADVAFILAFQLFRLLSILLVMPPLLKKRFKK